MPRTSERPAIGLRDVAKEAGVSLATASRALNAGPRNVKAEARKKVMEAADRLGYRPNLAAQATAKGMTQTIALVVSDIQDPYYSTIAQGAIESAAAAGLIVTIAGSGHSARDDLSVVRALRGLSPQMIIMTGSRRGTPETQKALINELSIYQARGGRVVVIGQDDLPFDTVSLGHCAGAATLAEALIGLGYRRPVLLAPPPGSTNFIAWETGLMEGAQRNGIEINASYIHRSSLTRDGAYDVVRRLARHGMGNTDLLIAASDLMAIGAMSALRDAGIEPGNDMGVAGFDNVIGSTDVTPELTTVDLGLAEAGAAAVTLGMAEAGERQIRVTPAKLMIRESTPAISRA